MRQLSAFQGHKGKEISSVIKYNTERRFANLVHDMKGHLSPYNICTRFQRLIAREKNANNQMHAVAMEMPVSPQLSNTKVY